MAAQKFLCGFPVSELFQPALLDESLDGSFKTGGQTSIGRVGVGLKSNCVGILKMLVIIGSILPDFVEETGLFDEAGSQFLSFIFVIEKITLRFIGLFVNEKRHRVKTSKKTVLKSN